MTRRNQIRALLQSERKDVSSMMAAYSLAAVDHAASQGRTLDYSERSPHDVEALLDSLHRTLPGRLGRLFGHGPNPKQIEAFAKMYGGYLGFVMVFEWGEGEWIVPEDGPFKSALCVRRGQGALTSPPAKAYKRIVDGPADDIMFYYEVLSQDRKP